MAGATTMNKLSNSNINNNNNTMPVQTKTADESLTTNIRLSLASEDAAAEHSNSDSSAMYSSDEDEDDMLLWRLDVTESRADWTLLIKVTGDDDDGEVEDNEPPQEPQQYHVHKTILGLGTYKSLYLSRLFRQRIPSPPRGGGDANAPPVIANKTTIPLPAAEAKAFPVLLDFIYSRGVVFPMKLTASDVSALTRLAHHFSVPSLDRAIQTFLSTNTVSNDSESESEYASKSDSTGEVSHMKTFKPIMSNARRGDSPPCTPAVGVGSHLSALQVSRFERMAKAEYTDLHPEMFRQYVASQHLSDSISGEELCTRVTDFCSVRLKDVTLSWLDDVMGSNNARLFTVPSSCALRLLHCVVQLSQREDKNRMAHLDHVNMNLYDMPLPPWESSSTLLLKNRCIQTLSEMEETSSSDALYQQLPEQIKMQVLQASLHRGGRSRSRRNSSIKRPVPQQASATQEPAYKRFRSLDRPSTPTR